MKNTILLLLSSFLFSRQLFSQQNHPAKTAFDKVFRESLIYDYVEEETTDPSIYKWEGDCIFNTTKRSAIGNSDFQELCFHGIDANFLLEGDLNGDGEKDAILLFETGSYGGGNSWMKEYAIMIKEGKEYIYKSEIIAEAKFEQKALHFVSIKEGEVQAYLNYKYTASRFNEFKIPKYIKQHDVILNFIYKNGFLQKSE